MHILFLTDNFPPEGNAPATRTYEHATHWVRMGHKVTIITCAPNFPDGKLFEGYKNAWYQTHKHDGIKVVRVKTYITANEGTFKRILDYMSFMVAAFFAGIFQKKPDIIIATSPQFFCACAGWLLSVLKRKPFVFELRDIWPASITAVGAMKHSFVIRMIEKIELFLYRRADSIITVTHAFKGELISRGIDSKKIDVVLNGVELSLYEPFVNKDPDLLKVYELETKFIVGYIGTHGMAHGLEHIVGVAEFLKAYENIRFIFVGGGAERKKIIALVKEKKLKNVIFIDRQEKKVMPKIWSLCDISLVPLINKDLFRTVIPSKIFECMAMGIPIVMSVPEGEATAIIRETNSGLVVESENVEQIANAILSLYGNNGLYERVQNCSMEAAPLYSRAANAKIFISILEKVIK